MVIEYDLNYFIKVGYLLFILKLTHELSLQYLTFILCFTLPKKAINCP